MSQANPFEQQMLALINQERASHGLDALQLELRLNAAAEDYSSLMLAQDFFSHTGPGNTTPGDRMEDAGFSFSGLWTWGENIAWKSEGGALGISDDVAALHQSLMNSPGHRANILNPNFELIGIGIERGDYNGWDAVMVTQKFATTSAPVQIDDGDGSTPPSDDLVLIGDSFNNTLTGSLGHDTLKGRGGADQMVGNGGNDLLNGQSGNDQAWGNAGADILKGGNGRDILSGGLGADKLKGNRKADELRGNNGDDRVLGGKGKDTLDGGKGDDILTGGAGADHFIFSTGDDRITDFNTAKPNEVIDLSDLSSITGYRDLRANHLSEEANGDAVISDGMGNTLTLQAVGVDDLDKGDFLF